MSTSFWTSRPQFKDNTELTDVKFQRCDRIIHLLKAVRRKQIVDHNVNGTALWQKLIIHFFGKKRLELWVAWEDGEIDFIFPECPELLFNDKLQEILKNWEEHKDPLAKYIDQFLSAYRDLMLHMAGVFELAKDWLGPVNCKRNGRCYVLEKNLIILVDALFSDLSRKKFPELKIHLEYTVSPQKKKIIDSKFHILGTALNFEELERLRITDSNQGVSAVMQSEWRRNKGKWRNLEQVSAAFEHLFDELIRWNADQTRYLDEFHGKLIERFQSGTLIETQDSRIEFGQIGKTWNFVFKVDGKDLLWSVKIEVWLRKIEGWLLIETCSTKWKARSGKERLNIREDVDDSVRRVRQWIESHLPPNISG